MIQNVKFPVHRGDMRRVLIILAVMIVVVLTACKEKAPQQRGQGPGGREETVIIEVMIQRDLNEYIRLSGVLEGKTDISFNSEVSGRIVELYKSLGDNVRTGEAIGKTDNADLEIQVMQAEAAVFSAEASVVSAEVVYNGNVELFENGRISAVEFHTSESAFKSAQATLQGARATLESRKRALQNSQFFAPVDGQIVDLPIRVGQTITVGQKIAGIVDVATLKIRTGVGESAIRSIYRGQTALITHRNIDGVITGRVTGVGHKPLTNIATYPLEIEINNSARKLIPGLVVNCEILSYVNRAVIYTLMSNIQKEYDTDFVYIVDDQNIIQKRIVTLGKQISENVIITDGIEPRDRLVVDGHDRIKEGSKVAVREF